MTRTVSLLFGVHAHQPAGNFIEVVDDAHARSYGPFIRTVYHYPEFRFAIHFSGWLLALLLERFPDDMALLAEMVARRQAEIFGGGDMEPVLAAIPARDRRRQLEALSERLDQAFGQRPRGAWLTERVWEATVVASLADAKLDYVTVDDYHFLCAGREPGELTGYFSTEDDGRRLDLFPISEQLRYRLPFAPADEAVRYIESLAADGPATAAIYFDDIEKFGIWPETYEWVYEKKWLEQFIEGVLASPLIRPRHFGDFHREERTRGVVYLPTTSYAEMGEWTLNAPRADIYAELIERAKREGTADRHRPFIRGGIWRNFMSRYAEANWMHKRMLGLSARLDRLPPERCSAEQRDLLHRAQANDAYWHGLFGGIYLPHLRRAVWNAMVALEASLAAPDPRPSFACDDLDLDGNDEIVLANPTILAFVRDDGEAALTEFDAMALAHNFADTLQRRREHYYRNVAANAQEQTPTEGIASAHDRVTFKHDIVAADLQADTRPRGLFIDTWIAPDGIEQMPNYQRHGSEQASFVGTVSGGAVTKRYRLRADGIDALWSFDNVGAGIFRVGINLAMPSCDGFLGRIVHRDQVLGGLAASIDLRQVTDIVLEDRVLGGAVTLRFSQPCALTIRPLMTVSQSEAGFEKIMQAVTLTAAATLPSGSDGLEISVIVQALR